MTDANDEPMLTLAAEDCARTAAAWVLRICIAGMCVGYGGSMFGNTAWRPPSGFEGVSGWVEPGLGASGAHLIYLYFRYVLIVLGVLVVVWPQRMVCTAVSIAVLLLMAADMSHSFSGASWSSLKYKIDEMMMPAARASRWLAPVVLILLIRPNAPSRSFHWPILILRFAAAGTFAVHGYEAFNGDWRFVNLITNSGNTFGILVEDATAELALKIIGAVDIIVAALVLIAPWRPVVAWMAFWGFLAAASRMTAHGWELWYETAIRLPNGGVPLALLCLWWYRKAGDDGDV